MSGISNVGQASVYEDGDQKNVPKSQIEQEKKDNRFHEGKENSHKALDSKDERSIANKLAREEKVGQPSPRDRWHRKKQVDGDANDMQRQAEEEEESEETKALKKDPTLPAKMHGNEPSKGAKIDAQIQKEEEEELKRKGKA
ncbi:hypothetical protein MBM_00839 [Drepanopeziza brunnea f. sp. 'multigermtubi' MB_m1]|uniref:Uncharacterized protein n=1 Tax=Marssonina brunnea f. sp. multigermtubi (strain MB_m1) TaxID=1072389 RepID=K1X9H4_MARBU|nr:uncharacterized protein MBM_00839 [Drepanopeziza brunnea f. sp. 'multigermtubi' MB_m1]EKD21726.1 hypothetical protein MBM_00839 [Drepanopeziza brunnea f. sp. 'multigermtubi' MB_m1]